jgi:MFS family permease
VVATEPLASPEVVAAPVVTPLRAAAVLAALMTGLLLGALDNFIVVTALPTIAQDLNDVSGQVFVVSAYLIAQTVAIPIFGSSPIGSAGAPSTSSASRSS